MGRSVGVLVTCLAIPGFGLAPVPARAAPASPTADPHGGEARGTEVALSFRGAGTPAAICDVRGDFITCSQWLLGGVGISSGHWVTKTLRLGGDASYGAQIGGTGSSGGSDSQEPRRLWHVAAAVRVAPAGENFWLELQAGVAQLTEGESFFSAASEGRVTKTLTAPHEGLVLGYDWFVSKKVALGLELEGALTGFRGTAVRAHFDGPTVWIGLGVSSTFQL